jgi:hypothetical protein
MLASVRKAQRSSEAAASAPPARPAEPVRLSWEVALDLAVCGGLLAGLSALAQHLQPQFDRTTLFTGSVGGGLCVVWSILGRWGRPFRVGAMVTLAVVGCMFARQTVNSWAAAAADESEGRKVMALMAVVVAFCVGMLANLVRERKKDRSHD